MQQDQPNPRDEAPQPGQCPRTQQALEHYRPEAERRGIPVQDYVIDLILNGKPPATAAELHRDDLT